MIELGRRELLAAAACSLTAMPLARAVASTPIYRNPLRQASDLAGWKLEGAANLTFAGGCLTMENARPPEDGQAANFVLWCPEEFPADIEISWDFLPLREPGLSILFFAAKGLIGGMPVSVFDPRLAPRQGLYDQYNNSDISYLSLSYFRRRWAEERDLNVLNLRSAPGFKLLAQAADPIPSAGVRDKPLRMIVRKHRRRITFVIAGLTALDWKAPEGTDWPGAGRIAFRQMAPLRAQYANLEVRDLTGVTD